MMIIPNELAVVTIECSNSSTESIFTLFEYVIRGVAYIMDD